MKEVNKLINGFHFFEKPEELYKITKSLKKYSPYKDIAHLTAICSAVFGIISIWLVLFIKFSKNVSNDAIIYLIVSAVIFALLITISIIFKVRSDNIKEFDFKIHFPNARIKDFDSIVYVSDDEFKTLASSELINKYSELAKESNEFSIFLNNLIKKRDGNILYVDTLMLGNDYINNVLSIIKRMKETKQDSINSLNHLKNTINYQS
ncbi:hypothetical protein R4681_17700 [Acinetobacter baumannii]|nr:hypothetical protein [Acinetobacter baumannii]